MPCPRPACSRSRSRWRARPPPGCSIPTACVYRSLKRQPAALLGTYLAVFRYHEYEERFTPETHLRAREELERAIQEEPGYAEAWAVLANVYLGEALFGFNRTLPRPALIEKCLDLAHQAVAMDPRGVMAHYILAMILFYRKDRSRFMAAADQALALAPHPDNLAVVGCTWPSPVNGAGACPWCRRRWT